MSTFAPRLAPLSKCSISWTAPGFSRLFKGAGLMVTGKKMLFPWEPAAPVTSPWTLRPRTSRLQSGPQFRKVLFSSMWKRPEVYDLCEIWNISKYIKAQCLLIVFRTDPRGGLGPGAWVFLSPAVNCCMSSVFRCLLWFVLFVQKRSNKD